MHPFGFHEWHQHVTHHAANIAAIAFPVTFLAHGAQVLAVLSGVLGVAWYLALFYDRWLMKRKQEKGNGKDTG
jgi:hypothetical protein